MRKEIKEKRINTRGSIQGYHQGIWNSQSYAFQGFTKNLYYNSDRAIELDGEFRRKDGKPLKGYGLEIETESTMLHTAEDLQFILKNLCTRDLPEDLFKYQHDGSLSGVSVEMITQPMTREFIRNHYPQFKAMYSMEKMMDISASASGRCGMHVNMSLGLFGTTKERQYDAVRKLYYIVNKHYELIAESVKRRLSNTHYCSRMKVDECKEITIQNVKSCNIEAQGNGSHGYCMNLSHMVAGRVELRLVGGQADYFSFRNTMEVVFHLVEAVKALGWDELDDFRKIFKGCNQYVVKRLIDCVGKSGFTREDYQYIAENMVTEEFGIN